ncbi:MAG: aldehyde dehydrogenase family protein [Myxococcota bacterium]|nr:aldehyde dehydrogenase family protein [Myxococcota bacterium]
MDQPDLSSIHADLRATFRSGKTRSLAWRKGQLRQLERLIKENEGVLEQALHADLRKSAFEGWITELYVTKTELKHTLKHFEDWMQPEEIPTPAVAQPASSTVVREPLGVVLLIGPWNYPVQLSLAPMIPAIAAGNCILIKPSEVAAATSKVIAELVPRYMDPDAIRVVEGGVPETSALLDLHWDHIFFTGSTAIGKIIMAAAAKHLTPVTLELGGKSPCIIDQSAKLSLASKRILWGKLYNVGQTCVASDYILVHKSREQELYASLERTLKSFYPNGAQASPDYGRIINERHFDRLVALLEGQEVVQGGGHDRDDLFIEPTILKNVAPDSPVMSEEIFGPILPVLTWEDLDEAIEFINDRPKPLALYVFTSKGKTRDAVLSRTSSGGACVNQTVMHLGVPDLPFGGVGASGMGAYHGRSGFETFSHRKSVFKRGTLVDVPLIYPPYSEGKVKWARRLL